LTPDEFFAGHDRSRQLFEGVHRILDVLGDVELRVTKSQIAFYRKKAFAWVWMPAQYLRGKVAPLVLTLSLYRRDGSSRWKEIVEPSPGRFTHHLELYAINDLDAEVCGWLREAWETADV
jgi:hypothetical protein